MTQYSHHYFDHTGNPLASDPAEWSNIERSQLDPELDPHLTTDIMQQTSTPPPLASGSSYALRPRISLTPQGKAQQECQSLATARRNNLDSQSNPELMPTHDGTSGNLRVQFQSVQAER